MPLTIEGTTLTVNGNTAAVNWTGGRGTAAAYGTFGGGTATLQASYDNAATWFAVGDDTTIVANGHGNFELPGGVLLRWNLSGSAGASVTFEIRTHGPGTK